MLAATVSACPMCAATEFEDFARAPELVFVRCTVCRSVYRAAEDPEALAQAYDAEYFTGGDIHAKGYDRRFARRVAKARANCLLALESATVAPACVLDVGCSLGYALEAARGLGLKGIGVDVSAFAVKACRARQYDARLGAIDATGLADRSVSVALLRHILEHTPTPRRSLAEMARVICPGGALYVELPHIGYWKAQRRRHKYKWFRPDWIGAEHFVYPTPAILRRMLHDAGFTAIRAGRARWQRRAIKCGQRRLIGEAMSWPGRALHDGFLALLPLLCKTWVMTARRA